MLKLKQAELEEIKEVRKSVFGDADFDDEGLCLHVWLATATKRRDAYR